MEAGLSSFLALNSSCLGSGAIDQNQAGPFVTGSQWGHSCKACLAMASCLWFSPTIPLPGSRCGLQTLEIHTAAKRRVVTDNPSSPSCPRTLRRSAVSSGSTFQTIYQVGLKTLGLRQFSYKTQFYLCIILGLKNSTAAALSLMMIHSFHHICPILSLMNL